MNGSYIISVEKMNELLSVVYPLHLAPIYLTTFNTGIKVNFGVESINCCFQLVYCLDNTIDLQFNNNGDVVMLLNGNVQEIKEALRWYLE